MGVYSKARSTSESAPTEVGHVLEMVLENERNDLNMFNSVISLDFSDAYNEAGMCFVTEEDSAEAKGSAVKNIFAKIGEVLNTAIKKIGEFFLKFIGKVENLVVNDKKLVSKYLDKFQANAKNYKFNSFTSINEPKIDEITDDITDVVNLATDSIEKIEDNGSNAIEVKDEVKKTIDERSKNLSSTVNSIFFGKERKNTTLTSDEVSVISKAMSDGKSNVTKIKETQEDIQERLDDLKEVLKDQKKVAAKGDAMAVANALYSLVSACSSFASKLSSAYCNGYIRFISACRHTFILVASNGERQAKHDEKSAQKAAQKEAKKAEKAAKKAEGSQEEEATEESVYADAYEFMLAEASDIYVESALSMTA